MQQSGHVDGTAVAIAAALGYLNAHHDASDAVRTTAGIATARQLRVRALALTASLGAVTDLTIAQAARRTLLLLRGVMYATPDAASVQSSHVAQVLAQVGASTPVSPDDPRAAQRMLPASAQLALQVVGKCVEQSHALGPSSANTNGEPEVLHARTVMRSMQAGQVTR